ncbi:MAG: DUF6160 family protein [Desulfosudaceae bacterium]
MRKIILTLAIGALLALPLSAMAMDAVTNAELDGVAGQAGVTIGFGTTSTTTVTFSSVAWGDPDGYDSASGAGWLIIGGDTGIEISQEIPEGEKLELDIATGTDYEIVSGASTINGDKTFIAVGLPSINTNISTPDTMNVELSDASTGGTVGTLGILRLGGLSIDQGTPDKLFVYAH